MATSTEKPTADDSAGSEGASGDDNVSNNEAASARADSADTGSTDADGTAADGTDSGDGSPADKDAGKPDDAEACGADDEEEGEEVANFWEDFRDFYLTFDRRTLGFARIMLGFFLLMDLWRRTDDWWKMYSDQGVLPTHFNLWRPQSGGFSIFNAFSTVGEVWVLWAVGLCIYLCVFFGYKTRIAQVLAAIFVACMNGRVLLIENGGYVVHNLLLLWTAFLPMGDRFSIDALLKSFKTTKEKTEADLNDRSTDTATWRLTPHVSLVGLVLLVQLAAVYGFNWKHKTGPAWHNGTGVHYVLWVDRMVTPLIAEVREYAPRWLVQILTFSVMGVEAGLPIALLSPLARVWAKRFAIGAILFLHIGFGSTFVLGPFAWALCCFAILLFSREDWELAYQTMRRSFRARTVVFHPTSSAQLFWCRVLKRLDRFELLSFRASTGAGQLGVVDGRETLTGTLATAQILSALPAGPLLGVPMGLPGVRQLSGAFGSLTPRIERLFGLKQAAVSKDGAADTGIVNASGAAINSPAYSPELRDDADHPTIDGYFMFDWFEEFYETKLLGIWQWWLGVVAAFVGGFFWIYGPSMAKKYDVKSVKTLLRAGADEKAVLGPLLGPGFILLVVGILLVARPFITMNLKTPSPLQRKWLRVVSGMRELFIMVMFAGAINQAVVELWVFRPFKLPQPAVMRILSHKLRYLQGWFMFSPNPVMDDGVLFVDAITVDGRRVDPFRADTYDYVLGPVDFDLPNARSYAYNQIWSDYFNRMHLPANSSFRKPMKEYMYRLPERTGNPNDAIVKGVAYWVHDMNPKWGRTNSYKYGRKQLFIFTNPDQEVQALYQKNTGGVDPAPLPVPLTRDHKGKPLNDGKPMDVEKGNKPKKRDIDFKKSRSLRKSVTPKK